MIEMTMFGGRNLYPWQQKPGYSERSDAFRVRRTTQQTPWLKQHGLQRGWGRIYTRGPSPYVSIRVLRLKR